MIIGPPISQTQKKIYWTSTQIAKNAIIWINNSGQHRSQIAKNMGISQKRGGGGVVFLRFLLSVFTFFYVVFY